MPGRSILNVGKRKLVAKTCALCGEIKDAAQFPRVIRPGGTYHNSECNLCIYGRTRVIHNRTNDESLEFATNHRERWTESAIRRMEDLFDQGLTAREVAKKLGRSVHAITVAKTKFLKEV